MWCSNIPAGALPALIPALHKELATKAYGGDFKAFQSIADRIKKTQHPSLPKYYMTIQPQNG